MELRKTLFLFLLLGLIYGCAPSGFHQGMIQESLNYNTVTTDSAIAQIMDLKPQITAPFKLGIYLDQKALNRYEKRYWHWVEVDRDSIVNKFKEYYGDLFSDVFFIPTSMVGDGSLKAVRTAAARHKADGVLILKGVSDIDSYGNFWSWTYLTIVMAWIVPGTDINTYYKMNAALWDVRNEYLYCTAETDIYKSFTSPGFLTFKNEKEAIKESKNEAFSKILAELKTRLDALYPKK